METHTTSTNQFGLANLDIGNGTHGTQTFSGIDWFAGPYFIKIELSTNGGTSYTLSGTSQLLSVPYALYANKSLDAWRLSGNSGTTIGTNFIGTTDNNDLMFKIDGQEAGFIEYSNPNRSTAFGYQALVSELSINAGHNAAFGYSALTSTKSGTGNSALGFNALGSNVSGIDNTAVGYDAMTNTQTGNFNTAIGSFSGPLAYDYTNTTALGAYSYVNASNSLTLGGTGNYHVNVGIGTSAPHKFLEINYSGTQASDTNFYALELT